MSDPGTHGSPDPLKDAAQRRRRRRLLFAVGALVIVGVSVLLLWEPVKVRYLAYRVRAADSPQAEREAFSLVNRETYGYAVLLFNEDGEELLPSGAHEADRIVSVEIRWRSGYRIRRKVLNADNVEVLMHE